MHRSTALATAFLLLPITAAVAERPIEHETPAARTGIVRVRCPAGSVEVSAWDRPTVRLAGTAGDGVTEVALRSDGQEVHVEVTLADRAGERHSDAARQAHLRLQVPADSELTVATVVASIAVRGITRSVDAESVDGDVTITGEPSQARAKSVSGDLKLELRSLRAVADTVSGAVTVEGEIEDLMANTVDSELRLEGPVLRRTRLGSVSGTILFRGSIAAAGHLEVEAHNAVAELRLPADVEAAFDLETFSGEIESSFGSQEPEALPLGGQRLHFTLGDSGGRVRVRSLGGTIRLVRQ